MPNEPFAGQVDVDIVERQIMDHRGWCGALDGTSCGGCRHTAIEAIAALRPTGRLVVPPVITSFVHLRRIREVWHFDVPPDHPDVLRVEAALVSEQCMGTPVEAAKVAVAALLAHGILKEGLTDESPTLQEYISAGSAVLDEETIQGILENCHDVDGVLTALAEELADAGIPDVEAFYRNQGLDI